MPILIAALWIAGFVQLAIALADFTLPRKLNYRENLSRLAPMVRQILLSIPDTSSESSCSSPQSLSASPGTGRRARPRKISRSFDSRFLGVPRTPAGFLLRSGIASSQSRGRRGDHGSASVLGRHLRRGGAGSRVVRSCDQIEVESAAANAVTKSSAEFATRHSVPPLAAPPRAIRAHGWIGWLPLIVLPLAVLMFRDALPAWAFMWLLAGGIFAGFEWQTWWDATVARCTGNSGRTLAYLLLWPGMDADEFFEPRTAKRRIAVREWMWTLGKTLAGAVLISAAAHKIVSRHPMAAGWMAMIGLVLVLHSGTFQLIAIAWQRAGIDENPSCGGRSYHTRSASFGQALESRLPEVVPRAGLSPPQKRSEPLSARSPHFSPPG